MQSDKNIRYCVGRQLRHDVKNVPMLLRAQCESSGIPDVHFVMAGEGDLEGRTSRQAGSWVVENVL
jgi:hypothetical protein